MIRPLRDNLILRPIKNSGMVGMIHMPEVGKLSCKTGSECEVVAAGKDATEAKVGSRVHVSSYDKKIAGTEIEVDGEKLILIRERDINGIIE